jgi:hypothetical protein
VLDLIGIRDAMTRLLEKAVEAVRRLSADEQDEIARTILALLGSE